MGFLLKKKSIYQFVSYLIALILAFCLIYFFSKSYGLLFISYSVLFAYLLKGLLSSYIAQKIFPLKWEYNSFFIIILFTLIFGIISNILEIYISFKASYLFNNLILFIYPLVSYFYFISRKEKIQIFKLYKNYKIK